MSISFSHSGDFKKTEKFLLAMKNLDATTRRLIDTQARAGVEALKKETPRESGLAAESWSYKIVTNKHGIKISWHNTNVENGFPVAIALQYGYGTGTGGYVQGRDYINPAMRPIFDKIADEVWKAVTSA